MKIKKIIVSGSGGDIGYNVGRILKNNQLADIVIGLDVKKIHCGLKLFDKCLQIPFASSNNYLEEVTKILEREEAEFFIVLPEPEIEFFYKNKITKIGNTKLVYADEKILDIGLDKYKTYQFLVENKIEAPWTEIDNSSTNLIPPCIYKKRSSCGSKDIKILNNLDEVKNSDSNGYIYQELLKPDNQEYTCAIYKTKENEIRTITMHRTLHGGLTGEGEVVDNFEIYQMLNSIANILPASSSYNVQLRLTEKGPRIFEINPRFSSTVYFRHLLGFQDLKWTLQELLDLKIDQYEKVKSGIKFFKVPSEVIIEGVE